MKAVLICLVTVAFLACSSDHSDINGAGAGTRILYHLEMKATFPGLKGTLAGIDYDGTAFWLVTFEEVGDYYDNDIVRLVQYDDRNDKVLKSYTYSGFYQKPSGLAWDGTNIWIYMAGSEFSLIEKINPADGNVIRSFAANAEICDLSFDGENLLLNYIYSHIEKVNPLNLELIKILKNPFPSGANFGIACREGEIWLSDYASDYINIIDENGILLGRVECDLLNDWNYDDSQLYLCFRDDNLVMANHQGVYVLTIQKTDR
jgi:hypothetical protein